MISRRCELARRLVRLYPRPWRERYGDEMLALIEDSGIDLRTALNMIIGAARERWSVSLTDSAGNSLTRGIGVLALIVLGGLALAGLATGCAALLARIDNPPRVAYEAGHTVVWPPALPGAWALLGPATAIALIARVMIATYTAAGRWRLGLLECCLWIAAAFSGSAMWQWQSRTANLGTGIPLRSWTYCWTFAAPQMVNALLFVLGGSRRYGRWQARQRELIAAAAARRRASIPRNILGL